MSPYEREGDVEQERAEEIDGVKPGGEGCGDLRGSQRGVASLAAPCKETPGGALSADVVTAWTKAYYDPTQALPGRKILDYYPSEAYAKPDEAASRSASGRTGPDREQG